MSIVAVLTVLRERGTFGAVIVPFVVEPTGQNDLTSSLPIVSFAAGQATAVGDRPLALGALFTGC